MIIFFLYYYRYCNGRVIKYSADGTLLEQWGTMSNGNGFHVMPLRCVRFSIFRVFSCTFYSLHVWVYIVKPVLKNNFITLK